MNVTIFGSGYVGMEALWHAEAKVRTNDPEAMEECHRNYGDRKDLIL